MRTRRSSAPARGGASRPIRPRCGPRHRRSNPRDHRADWQGWLGAAGGTPGAEDSARPHQGPSAPGPPVTRGARFDSTEHEHPLRSPVRRGALPRGVLPSRSRHGLRAEAREQGSRRDRGRGDDHRLAAPRRRPCRRPSAVALRNGAQPRPRGGAALGAVRRRGAAEAEHVDQPPVELDPTLDRALRGLSQLDREALLLVAWEDLTPGQAAKALGISPVAFRVRLLRARRRFRASLEEAQAAPPSPHLNHLDVEGT